MGEAATPLKVDFSEGRWKAKRGRASIDCVTGSWHTPMRIADCRPGKHVVRGKVRAVPYPAEGARCWCGAEEVRQAGADGDAAAVSRHTIEVIEKIRAAKLGGRTGEGLVQAILGRRLA